jgi:hypothetical protein
MSASLKFRSLPPCIRRPHARGFTFIELLIGRALKAGGQ